MDSKKKKLIISIAAGVLALCCIVGVVLALALPKGGDSGKKGGPINQDLYSRVNADGQEDQNGEYIYYGRYPKTVKSENVTVTYTQNMGYLGSDGAKYIKESAQSRNDKTFSNGQSIRHTDYYFKVEKVKWRILTEKDGKALILAEDIIYSGRFGDYNEYNNEGATGNIREYVNREVNAYFTAEELAIADTTSAGKKAFVLSKEDIENSEYGFTADNLKKKQTDYSLAYSNFTDFSADGYSYWWTSTGKTGSSKYVYIVNNDGTIADTGYCTDLGGVVPAMWITL